MAAQLRLRHLWLFVPFLGLALRAGLPLRDNSFLWHVRAGVDQLGVGEVIRSDPYSFTRQGAPWRTQSWLLELGYGRLETWFPGLSWVPWFLFGVVAAALAVVLVVLWGRNGAHVGVIVVFAGIGWLSQPYAQPRPVAVSFVLFALVAALMGSRRPPLWVIPPLIWLWASMHGSFVVGLGFLVLDAMRRRSRRQAMAVGLGAAAATLTAHGVGVWRILLDFAANREGLQLIQEWQPPDFATPWLAAFVVLLAILMIGLAAGRIAPTALVVIIPAVAFGLMSARSVLPSVLLLTPWLGEAAGAVPDRPETAANRAVVWATTTGLVVAAVFALASWPGVDETLFPSTLAVAAPGDGPLFASVAAAGYLIYADDERRVFVDDRVELYGAELLKGYERARTAVALGGSCSASTTWRRR